KINNIKFKPYRSKWGECNSNNDISINTYLLFAPKNVLEYIIIHELAHIEMLNHSKNYWQTVDTIMPDRKSKENWLKNNGNNILNMQIRW
ncbi:MAG: M48 family metallopeptidase, partial [Vampirovibrionia bacterium]